MISDFEKDLSISILQMVIYRFDETLIRSCGIGYGNLFIWVV